jgi:hypothetical protein
MPEGPVEQLMFAWILGAALVIGVFVYGFF